MVQRGLVIVPRPDAGLPLFPPSLKVPVSPAFSQRSEPKQKKLSETPAPCNLPDPGQSHQRLSADFPEELPYPFLSLHVLSSFSFLGVPTLDKLITSRLLPYAVLSSSTKQLIWGLLNSTDNFKDEQNWEWLPHVLNEAPHCLYSHFLPQKYRWHPRLISYNLNYPLDASIPSIELPALHLLVSS